MKEKQGIDSRSQSGTTDFPVFVCFHCPSTQPIFVIPDPSGNLYPFMHSTLQFLKKMQVEIYLKTQKPYGKCV